MSDTSDDKCRECGQPLNETTHWVEVQSRGDIHFTVCGWRCLMIQSQKVYLDILDSKVSGAVDGLETIRTLLSTVSSQRTAPALKRIEDAIYFLTRGHGSTKAPKGKKA